MRKPHGWPEGMDLPTGRNFPAHPLRVRYTPDPSPRDAFRELDREEAETEEFEQERIDVREIDPAARGQRLLDSGNAGGSAITTADERNYQLFETRGNPHLPDQITIYGFREYPPDIASDELGLSLIIEWGIQSFTGRVEMDLLHGMAVSLMASYLRVSAGVQPGGYGVVPAGIRLTAGASYGIRPSHAPPQRTIRNVGVEPDDSVSAEVPAYARGVYPMVKGATDGQWYNHSVQQMSGNTVLSEHLYIAGQVISPLRIPLQGDCDQIVLNNLASELLTRANLVFDLSF